MSSSGLENRRSREGGVCVCVCLSCFLKQLLSWGDKRSSDITNVSKINSRLPLCGTVKAWKGDHMLGWGLRCWGQPHISYRWQVSSPSALSVCCCKTIKHLLTYILLIALSTWKTQTRKCPSVTDLEERSVAAFSQIVTAEGIRSDYMSMDNSTDLFAIDSSNQFN